MNGETPRFCTILESYFSDAICSKINEIEGFSLLNLSNSKYLSDQYNSPKKEINKNKGKNNKKELISINIINRNNIQEFMKKNKFILRNNFDGNNIEQFLLSKEEDFDNSFLLINDIIDNKQ